MPAPTKPAPTGQPGVATMQARAAGFKPPPLATAARSAWPFLGVLALAILAQFVLKPWLGDGDAFESKLLLDIAINIMLAVSLTLVNGFTGQFSIGHAAFMAIGGYASAGVVYYASAKLFGGEMFANATVHGGLISGMRTDLELKEALSPFVTSADLLFLVSLVIGGLLAAACGYLVGLPSLRLKGDYLAIVTLGFGEIVRVLIQAFTTDALWEVDKIRSTPWYELPASLGGPVGFSGLPFYTSLFWVTLFCGITLLVAHRLKESTHGRAFLSIRENEIAAEAMGVNTTKYKIRAFVIAAFFAGIAGGLYAHTVGVQLNAGELGFIRSFDIIIMVVLGGLGSISGAAIAAVILTPLPELLRKPGDLSQTWIWVAAAVAIAIGVALRCATKKGTTLRGISALLATIGGIALFLALLARAAIAYKVDLASYRMVLYALALIVMMILRPKGLLGVLELWSRSLWTPSPRRAHGALQTKSESDGPSGLVRARSASEGLISSPRPPQLAASGVSKSFGGLKAVQGFSLTLNDGDLCGLIGPNGAGKTTVFNLITGVYIPDTGGVTLGGHRLNGLRPHQINAAGLARTFQNIRLFGELSVLDNIKVGSHVRATHGLASTVLRTPWSKAEESAITARARELLALFGLADREHEQAKNLAYGDQRRLEIARALATEPSVLLLDEPAAGMNPQEKVELRGLIRRLRDQFQITILLIEHDMGVVMDLCERITVLDYGVTIAEGTPAQVQKDPKVIEAYLGTGGDHA